VGAHRRFALFTLVLVGIAVVGSLRMFRGRGQWPLWTLIGGLLLIPFLTVAFAIFVLHAYRDRYAAYEVIGLALALGVLLGPCLDRMGRPAFATLIALLALVSVYRQTTNFEAASKKAPWKLAHLQPPPEVANAFAADPGVAVIAPLETCLVEAFYGTPRLRAHLICVYSAEREIRVNGTDTVALTAIALASQPEFHNLPFDDALAMPGVRYVVHRLEPDETWERWIEQSLRDDGRTLTYAGEGLTGEVFQLSPKG
jgi:hypothetical protein